MENRIVVFVISIMLAFGNLFGQQEPMFTQYMHNNMTMNPAYAGTRNALSISALSRLQWVGLEGAPKTYNIALHAPVSSKHIGIGATVIIDEIGPLRNTYFTINYAYRLKLNELWTLSMGLKIGFNNFHLGLSRLDLVDVDDPDFYSDVKRVFVPNAGIGIYAYTEKFYIGLSAPKILQTKIETAGEDNSVLRRHYFMVTGYTFNLNATFKMKPSMAAKFVEGAPVSVDLTALLGYNDLIWLGPDYRIGDAIGVILNIQITKQLMIGYSFDYSVTRLSGYNKGSHEILISYDMDGFLNRKVKSPRYF